MIQSMVSGVVVGWAGWHVFSTLAPWRQRRLRAWAARRAGGWLPAPLLRRLRPGMPSTGCGCGSTCSGVSQASAPVPVRRS